MGHEAASEVQVSLLRGFELRVGRRPIPLVWSAQRLVAFLALKDRPLTRAYVAGTLWPETTAIKASANLRSSLWRTHRSCSFLIAASSQQLALAAGVVVDVRDAVSCAHRLLDPSARRDDDLRASVRANLSNDLLPDWYDDDWVVAEREQFHQLRLHALETMCERLTSVGRYGEAIDAGLAAVRAEPIRESAHQALVKTYLAEGNRLEAVRQYERCRRLLLEELGVEPLPELRTLLPRPRAAPRGVVGREVVGSLSDVPRTGR